MAPSSLQSMSRPALTLLAISRTSALLAHTPRRFRCRARGPRSSATFRPAWPSRWLMVSSTRPAQRAAVHPSRSDFGVFFQSRNPSSFFRQLYRPVPAGGRSMSSAGWRRARNCWKGTLRRWPVSTSSVPSVPSSICQQRSLAERRIRQPPRRRPAGPPDEAPPCTATPAALAQLPLSTVSVHPSNSSLKRSGRRSPCLCRRKKTKPASGSSRSELQQPLTRADCKQPLASSAPATTSMRAAKEITAPVRWCRSPVKRSTFLGRKRSNSRCTAARPVSRESALRHAKGATARHAPCRACASRQVLSARRQPATAERVFRARIAPSSEEASEGLTAAAELARHSASNTILFEATPELGRKAENSTERTAAHLRHRAHAPPRSRRRREHFQRRLGCETAPSLPCASSSKSWYRFADGTDFFCHEGPRAERRFGRGPSHARRGDGTCVTSHAPPKAIYEGRHRSPLPGTPFGRPARCMARALVRWPLAALRGLPTRTLASWAAPASKAAPLLQPAASRPARSASPYSASAAFAMIPIERAFRRHHVAGGMGASSEPSRPPPKPVGVAVRQGCTASWVRREDASGPAHRTTPPALRRRHHPAVPILESTMGPLCAGAARRSAATSSSPSITTDGSPATTRSSSRTATRASSGAVPKAGAPRRTHLCVCHPAASVVHGTQRSQRPLPHLAVNAPALRDPERLASTFSRAPRWPAGSRARAPARATASSAPPRPSHRRRSVARQAESGWAIGTSFSYVCAKVVHSLR